jgi:DNA-binding response OmpR family regulator
MRVVTIGGPMILVIEDEPAIASAVAARLRSEGFAVEVESDGPSGVTRCADLRPALVVLDLMLPGLDGLEVCRQIQREREVPVLMLTARDDEADVLVGLAVGADDYLTKPFSPRELVARVRTILRRTGRTDESTSGERVLVGTVELDHAARRARRGDDVVHLTSTEFDLVWFLAARPGAVFPREQLLAEVWGYRDGSGARTVDSHVRAVRRKLGAEVIRTVHGFGYGIGDGEP